MERLKQLREERGWSQKKLGEKLNVTNASVCQWEKGFCQPDSSMLVKIAEIFGVTVDYLIGKSLTRDLPNVPNVMPLDRPAYSTIRN